MRSDVENLHVVAEQVGLVESKLEFVNRDFAIPKKQSNIPASVKYASDKARNAMGKVEITIPERLEMQIAQMVEQGEFLDRDEAIEDLISTGLRAYQTSGPMEDQEDELEDDGMMGHEDEYVF